MASLVSQLRPADSEKYDRRCSTRKYDPNYNLCRHITLPPLDQLKDPKAPTNPFKLYTEEIGENKIVTTPYGVLAPGNTRDQFALHYQWRTTSQDAYVNYWPKPVVPPRTPCFHPHADMTRRRPWLGMSDQNGPYEYQEFRVKHGNLPESKAWASIAAEYRRFPHNTERGQNLFRYVRPRDVGGRSVEETERVKDHIRDLSKKNALSPIYKKHIPNYTGQQDEVRIYEQLQKSAGRNPSCMTTEHMATFGPPFPAEKYRPPEYGSVRSMSNIPVTWLARQSETHGLNDHQPLPWTFSKLPYDHRTTAS
ncbi:uncharacterized protein [Littorina saxatilis]|uniref:Uncharacterized protein n=1 Tax=Littorina saxatilis TaxID=31220 RepID=A0AAN9BX88_9CAEN